MGKGRLITTINLAGNTAKIYKDTEWYEYRVDFYKQGVKLDTGSYHTGDYPDAKNTADAVLKNYAIADELNEVQE